MDFPTIILCDSIAFFAGVIGNDPVALLSEALERAGMPCRISALLNDTIGVWAASR